MSPAIPYSHNSLDQRIVGRASSFFAEDMLAQSDVLTEALKGSRCLFIGASGSIGSETLRTVLGYGPKAVYVVDHNENGLAELVRDLRSQDVVTVPTEFVTLPFDYGSPVFLDWFDHLTEPFDYVFNFAALKHVRSEKDPYAILAMLDTNVMKLARLQKTLEGHSSIKRLFCVSTDKAANPSSMMGATKRLMEHALFYQRSGTNMDWTNSSARFANVASSNGSLLQSWLIRLRSNQPLACPEGCQRYFVTLPESGHLCTLAALTARQDQIFVPDMDPEKHLVLLEDVVQEILAFHGYEAVFMEDESMVKAQLTALKAQKKYPVLLTPLNTSGEKPYEEFVAEGERLISVGLKKLEAVEYRPPVSPASFEALLNAIEDRFAKALTRQAQPIDIEMLREMIGAVEPAFLDTHRMSVEKLDERM